MTGITDAVVAGPFLVAAVLSVAAGAVSFASPCVVPLVPGYLAYLASLVGAETVPTRAARSAVPEALNGGSRVVSPVTVHRGRVVAATALFVLGFTVVFLAQSVAVIGLTRALLVNNDTLMRVGGALTIVMGLAMLGLVGPLQRERRLHVRPTGRLIGAPLLGAVFALGWTVCLGPTLVGVLSLATATDWGGSAWRGLGLVICYCAGLGIPFLLLALGVSWAAGSLTFLRRHSRAIQIAGAVGLLVLGTLMLTGAWGGFIAWLQGRLAGAETLL